MNTDKKQTHTPDLFEFEKLSWKQLESFDRNNTIFFLPISPMEEHGPHLPVGTDLLIAKDAAIDAIKKLHTERKELNGILLPAVPVGFCKFNMDFPGSISIPSKMVKEIIISFSVALAKHGFNQMIICTYHMAWGHLKGIYAAISYLRKKYNFKICEPWSPVFYSDAIKEKEPKLGFDTEKEIHGGFRETSLMKYQYPYLVDPSYKNLQSIYRDLNSPKVIGKTFKELGIKDGYIGSPAKADTDYGRWFYQLTVDTYTQTAIKMIKGEELPDLPSQVKSKIKLLFWQ